MNTLLLLFAVMSSGCATRVIVGPTQTRMGSIDQAQAQAAINVFKSKEGKNPALWAHLQQLADKKVYLPDWNGDEGQFLPYASNAMDRYLATMVAEGLVEAGATLVFEPIKADTILFIRSRIEGGWTTSRQWWIPFFRVYIHDEAQSYLDVRLFGLDGASGKWFAIGEGRGSANFIEPFILDIFGYKVMF